MPRRISPAIRLFLVALVWIVFDAALNAQNRQLGPDTDRAILLVTPERVRQGDLLIAYLIGEAPLSCDSALLLGPDGAIVASAPAHALTSLSAEFSAAPEASRSLPVARSQPKPRPMVYVFFIAVPTRLAQGLYRLSAGGAVSEIIIEKHAFYSETINLDEKNTAIRTQPDRRKEEEAKKLYALLARVDHGAFYAGFSSFSLPVSADARRSSLFGDRRIYVYSNGCSESSDHAGIDFAVPTGTAVRACARGKVVMAEERIVTGKTLVIEHFPGVYSIYMHLSEFDSAPGALVEQGQCLGRSGSTGLSTGPHLHWEIRVRGSMVDPESLCAAPPLDKALIINTIRALIEGR